MPAALGMMLSGLPSQAQIGLVKSAGGRVGDFGSERREDGGRKANAYHPRSVVCERVCVSVDGLVCW